MKPSHWQWLKRLFTLLEIPAPDPPRLLRRIEIMERNIMLPVKAVAIGIHFLFVCFDAVVWADVEHAGCDGGNGSVYFLVLHAGQRAPWPHCC